MDPGHSPERVGGVHLPNQITSLAIHSRPPSSRTPTQIEPEAFAVLSDYGRWLDQDHRLQATRPYPVEEAPLTLAMKLVHPLLRRHPAASSRESTRRSRAHN